MSGILRAIGALFFNRRGTPEPEESPTLARAEAAKVTVLVIDDDQSVLDSLRPLLQEAGFTVLTAISGAKGLDMLRYAQKDVRVVLLDYNMPRFSGADTLQYLHKLAPHTKVVALTGVEPALLPEEYRTTVDRVVAKPFRADELVRGVKELAGLTAPKVVAA